MTGNSAPRSSEEIRQLLEKVGEIFQLGGPLVVSDDGSTDVMEPVEYHSYLICELRQPSEDIETFMAHHFIDSYEGLQALLRIVASFAAINALSWVLEEPAPDADLLQPCTELEVLAAARTWPFLGDEFQIAELTQLG